VHAVFETPEHDPVALVSLESGLAGALLEQLCGSSGAGAGIAGLSALSRQLLMAALGPLGDVIGREAGMPVVLSRIETQAHLAVLAPLPETHALEWVMRASVGHGPGVKDAVTGSARVQVRVRAAQGEVAVVAGAERGWQRGEAVAGPALPAGLETRLCVRLARLSLTTAQVARWAPGQTLLLGLPADQPVSVLAGSMTGMGAGAPLAEGQIGRLGAAMAVRITRLNGPLRRPG
jgi:flagellar motor switch/type III secretory pathway protein FliN